MENSFFRIPTLMLASLILVFEVWRSLSANAQTTNNYQPWANPNQQNKTTPLNDVLNQLDVLTKNAAKAKAADPQFIKDLQALVTRYRKQPITRILSDDFSDGNFTQNPKWQVVEGRYFLEKGWGLRNAVETKTATTTNKKLKGKDIAIALFGEILGQGSGQTQPQQNVDSGPQPTAIYTNKTINNSFSITLKISSWAQAGMFDVAVFQGDVQSGSTAIGYHLQYQSGQPLKLIRRTGSRQNVIAQSKNPFWIEDKKIHAIEWKRDTAGVFRIVIDSKQVIQASDISFKNNFDGLLLSSQGGDFIIGNVDVYN